MTTKIRQLEQRPGGRPGCCASGGTTGIVVCCTLSLLSPFACFSRLGCAHVHTASWHTPPLPSPWCRACTSSTLSSSFRCLWGFFSLSAITPCGSRSLVFHCAPRVAVRQTRKKSVRHMSIYGVGRFSQGTSHARKDWVAQVAGGCRRKQHVIGNKTS